MPAGPDAVFAAVSDLERLTESLPHGIRMRPTDDDPGRDPARAGGDVTEVHAEVVPRHVDAHGLVRVRPDQMRVEWGGGGSTDYAGSLQVMCDHPDRSSVLHLSFLGDQPETRTEQPADEMRGLDAGLDGLARMLAERATRRAGNERAPADGVGGGSPQGWSCRESNPGPTRFSRLLRAQSAMPLLGSPGHANKPG